MLVVKIIQSTTPFAVMLFSALLTFTYVPVNLHAADIIGRYGGEFLAVGGGARPLALGGANTALSEDAWSLFWNPSGLVRIDKPEIGLMHNERFDGVVDYDAVVLALPRPDLSTMSVGIIRMGINGIPFTTLEQPGQPISNQNRIIVDRMVNAGYYGFFFGLARKKGELRWGIAPKLIYKHIDAKAVGLGIDAGISGTPFKRFPLNAGLAVRDLFGTVLAWDTGREEIVLSTLRAGLSTSFHISTLEATITPVMDVAYRFEAFGDSDAASLHAGCEYKVRNLVALRIGSDDGRLTFGGGVSLLALDVDYAFVDHDDLNSTHRVSLTIRWGEPGYDADSSSRE